MALSHQWTSHSPKHRTVFTHRTPCCFLLQLGCSITKINTFSVFYLFFLCFATRLRLWWIKPCLNEVNCGRVVVHIWAWFLLNFWDSGYAGENLLTWHKSPSYILKHFSLCFNLFHPLVKVKFSVFHHKMSNSEWVRRPECQEKREKLRFSFSKMLSNKLL